MLPVNFTALLDLQKAYDDSSGRWIVEGYAATADFDLQGDVITPEAIQASARDLIQNSTVLLNHDANEAIGRVLESRATERGLWLKVLISKTAPELWQKIREGVLNKFSIRGRVIDAIREYIPKLKTTARRILRMNLIEASLVSIPANPQARTLAWYVEKAMDEFEKSGGAVESREGDKRMDPKEQKDIGAPESSGEPVVTKSGFPLPDVLEKEWHEHLSGAGKEKAEGDELFEEWTAFCKQRQYPYPYPYPYPMAGRAQWTEVADLAESLVEDEKNAERKAKLQQIVSMARQACAGYPYPKKKAEPAVLVETQKSEEASDAVSKTGVATEEEVEKIGRKMASHRAARLRRVIEELKALAIEVDASDDAKKSEEPPAPETGEKPVETEKVEADGALGEKVEELRKRLEAIESIPASKTSIDGQDNEKPSGGGVWTGLV